MYGIDLGNHSDFGNDIGANAFSGCSTLPSVFLPSSVAVIGASAFLNCTLLEDVVENNRTPPISGLGAFDNNKAGRIIKVPGAVDERFIDTYKAAANWSTYAAFIQELP